MLGKILDIITRVVLFFAFFILVTPIGFALRLIGIDYLKRKCDKKEHTYWEPRSRS